MICVTWVGSSVIMLMWCHLFYWQLWPVYLSSSVLAVFVRGKCKYWKWKVMFFYEASCLMVCVCGGGGGCWELGVVAGRTIMNFDWDL